jgi:hypothetical protein
VAGVVPALIAYTIEVWRQQIDDLALPFVAHCVQVTLGSWLLYSTFNHRRDFFAVSRSARDHRRADDPHWFDSDARELLVIADDCCPWGSRRRGTRRPSPPSSTGRPRRPPVYGINTGFRPKAIRERSRRSGQPSAQPRAGVGDAAGLAVRVDGASGQRPGQVSGIRRATRAASTSSTAAFTRVPSRSAGASGDPRRWHTALVLIGEGQAWTATTRRSGGCDASRSRGFHRSRRTQGRPALTAAHSRHPPSPR